jgi:hypothetical protein
MTAGTMRDIERNLQLVTLSDCAEIPNDKRNRQGHEAELSCSK